MTNTDLKLHPEQALSDIDKITKKAIEYGNRVVQEGSADEIDQEIATESVQNACLGLIALLEQYPDKHRTLLDEARTLRKLIEADPLKVRVLAGEGYLTWPYKVQDIVDIFRSMYFAQEKTVSADILSLLNAISNAEYYITNPIVFPNVPLSEDDVRVRIDGMLKCFYPDVLPKPRLSKPIKSFEPDTGIPSLRTLIEYKYIKNQQDAKNILDEILADIGGYQTEGYNNFIFVVYETDRIVPKSDWIRAIAESKPQNPIEVIVLKGVPPSKRAAKRKTKSK